MVLIRRQRYHWIRRQSGRAGAAGLGPGRGSRRTTTPTAVPGTRSSKDRRPRRLRQYAWSCRQRDAALAPDSRRPDRQPRRCDSQSSFGHRRLHCGQIARLLQWRVSPAAGAGGCGGRAFNVGQCRRLPDNRCSAYTSSRPSGATRRTLGSGGSPLRVGDWGLHHQPSARHLARRNSAFAVLIDEVQLAPVRCLMRRSTAV